MATERNNRLALDENVPAQAGKDVDTGKSPVFTLNAPYALTVAHIVAGVVTSVADWANVRLQITSQRNKAGDRYVDRLQSAFLPTLTQAAWDAGLAGHATFYFNAADLNLALAPCDSGPLYYVFTALRNDGQEVPLGYGTINVDRAYQSGTNLVLAPAGSNFPQIALTGTVTQGPLSFAVLPGSAPNKFVLALSLPAAQSPMVSFGNEFTTFGDTFLTFGTY